MTSPPISLTRQHVKSGKSKKSYNKCHYAISTFLLWTMLASYILLFMTCGRYQFTHGEWRKIHDHNIKVKFTNATVIDYSYDPIMHDNMPCISGRVVYNDYCRADVIKCHTIHETMEFVKTNYPVNTVNTIGYIDGDKICTDIWPDTYNMQYNVENTTRNITILIVIFISAILLQKLFQMCLYK
ncbi:MAG: hypothetical protein Faunusvirus2_16 [Faunusvirus sp.]|jgi:hypothetical protein|uniref:Uncharacterized protein n=1 Tax=Faunusvirus sp. TaxID=2487766 RepID=A0A3G5A0H5_9VIRU|nr:MAG: hypothetical protein Faunusvirus2_16 [Faunusvirus sp.]